MTAITKKWLQRKIADLESCRDDIPFGLDENDHNMLIALKIALTSLEAEPVAWMRDDADGREYNARNEFSYGGRGIPLYAAPPVAPAELAGSINMPLQVEVEGRAWRLFSVEFSEDERRYSFYIYAINREHASYVVESIKQTAELSPGNIVGIVSSQDKD